VPRILDLSRSFSRLDRPVATGIDRVERAYWREVSTRRRDAWALIRSGRHYALLDRQQADLMMQNMCRGALAPRALGIVKHLMPGRVAGGCAETWLRRRATFFGSLAGLMSDLVVRAPHGFDYFNVGHSNLDDSVLIGLRRTGARSIAIMLHDMIPLDFPALVRNGTPEKFHGRSTAALTHADRIICNSHYTADRVRHYSLQMGARPRIEVAHLGVDLPCPDIAPRQTAVPDAPYFLCVGTIEPRKNHALLFEVWQKLITANPQDRPPKLILAGSRGWNNRAVFEFLDRSPLTGPVVEERGAVSDAELIAVMTGAKALLFPSLVEGFGLPALEAQALGLPVICSDIPAFREVLDQSAVFLPATQPDLWLAEVQRILGEADRVRTKGAVPLWPAHFETVLGAKVPR
jgi:glycosyltransferase involved in cell wall biosynthesis